MDQSRTTCAVLDIGYIQTASPIEPPNDLDEMTNALTVALFDGIHELLSEK